MKYAKIVNGELIFAPSEYELPDGKIITQFNQSVALMVKYGFKEVIDTPPQYDKVTQYAVIDSYTESATQIIVGYSVKLIDAIDDELTLEQKVDDLKSVDVEHELALAELTEMVVSLMSANQTKGV